MSRSVLVYVVTPFVAGAMACFAVLSSRSLRRALFTALDWLQRGSWRRRR